MYVYHFGVAKSIEERLKLHDPAGGCGKAVGFSGSSGGALVAATLACGVPVQDMADYVLFVPARVRDGTVTS